jgi:YesN/AraC family two-component response regulator
MLAKILIIEDEELVRKSIQLIAESFGGISIGVGSIKEALKYLNEEIFDIVLMDLSLPDGDGISLIPEIRKQKNSVEIIVLTGTKDENRAEAALKSGAWDFLLKPIYKYQLLELLTKYLPYIQTSDNEKKPESTSIISAPKILNEKIPKEFRAELLQNFLPSILKLQKELDYDNLILLGNQLGKFSNQNNIINMKEYCSQLKDNIATFNIDCIHRILKQIIIYLKKEESWTT